MSIFVNILAWTFGVVAMVEVWQIALHLIAMRGMLEDWEKKTDLQKKQIAKARVLYRVANYRNIAYFVLFTLGAVALSDFPAHTIESLAFNTVFLLLGGFIVTLTAYALGYIVTPYNPAIYDAKIEKEVKKQNDKNWHWED